MEFIQKKITIVFNSLNIGGIETKIIDICNYYSKQKKYQITLLLKNKTGLLLKKVPKNIKILSFSTPPFFPKIKNLYFPFWLSQKFHQIKPNLIISFGNFSSITSLIGRQLSFNKSNLIISEDSSVIQQINMDSFSFLRKILIKITYPLSQKIIVSSPASYSKLASLIPSSKSKIIIKKNWLPFTFKVNKIKKNKNIDILFLARLEPQKNPIRFLKIIKNIIKTQKNLKIYMVGSGSLKNKIEKYIFKNHLENKIILKPFTLKHKQYYQRSKILLISSNHEGFPLTILESLANKCLPIYFNLEEINSFFKKYRKFLSFKSVNDALQKINYLLSHPKQLQKITNFYSPKVIKNQKINFKSTINEFQKLC